MSEKKEGRRRRTKLIYLHYSEVFHLFFYHQINHFLSVFHFVDFDYNIG